MNIMDELHIRMWLSYKLDNKIMVIHNGSIENVIDSYYYADSTRDLWKYVIKYY